MSEIRNTAIDLGEGSGSGYYLRFRIRRGEANWLRIPRIRNTAYIIIPIIIIIIIIYIVYLCRWFRFAQLAKGK